jgi:molybdate transport system ATP-binding protein
VENTVTRSLKVRLQLERSSDFQLRIDCNIPLQGVTAIYGPSGCGKTSLLYCLAGLLEPESGSEILFADRIWQQADRIEPTHQRKLGFVFQDSRLFPHLNVAGNLDYAEQRKSSDSGPGRTQVCQWLQLDGLLERNIDQLSRGQQQRVAIARALLSAPDILLLDEPLANIDLASRTQILGHLERLQREIKLPMIYVSHDMEELARLADWLLIMESGRITAQGPVLELCSQMELAIAHEEQAAAIVAATVSDQEQQYGLSELSLEGQPMFVTAVPSRPGSTIRLRIPARDVSICLQPPEKSSILNIIKTRITEIEDNASPRQLIRLQAGGQFLLARVTAKSIAALDLQVGDTVYAQVKSVALLNEIHD